MAPPTLQFASPRSEKKTPVGTGYTEDGGRKLLHNNENYFLVDTVSYTRIPQYELISI
jgi:hypothetical protein